MVFGESWRKGYWLVDGAGWRWVAIFVCSGWETYGWIHAMEIDLAEVEDSDLVAARGGGTVPGLCPGLDWPGLSVSLLPLHSLLSLTYSHLLGTFH